MRCLYTFRSIWYHREVWLGLFIVSSLTAASVSLPLNLEASVQASTELSFHDESSSYVFPIVAFAFTAAFAVVLATARLIVASLRRDLGLNSILGTSPRAAALKVIMQSSIVSMAGAVLGTIASLPFTGAYVLWTLDLPPSYVIRIHNSITSSITAILIVLITALLGSLGAARTASRTRPLELYKDDTVLQKNRFSTSRIWLLVVCGLVLCLILATGIITLEFVLVNKQYFQQIAPSSLVVGFGIFFGVGLTGGLCILGPLVFHPIVRIVTSLVPGRASTSWFLGRRIALFRSVQSAGTISPVFVAISIATVLYTVFYTVMSLILDTDQYGASTQINTRSIISVLANPLVISITGAAVVIFMVSKTRIQESALLYVAGVSRNTMIVAALLEALIYVVAACIVAAMIAIIVGAYVALMTTIFGPMATVKVAVWPGVIVAFLSFVILSISTTLQVIAGSRQKNLRVLISSE